MLRITVELVPGGNEARARPLATAEISNVSEGLSQINDYAVDASEVANPLAGTPAWSSRGMIGRHDRRQSVWRLVEKVAAWAATEAEKT